MKNNFLVFLFVLHTSSCKVMQGRRSSDAADNVKTVKNATNRVELLKDNNKIHFNMSCATLAYNCPPITSPVCVKIRYKTEENKNKTVYVVMVNKCEMDYLNICYGGIKADEIPMEKCDVNGSDAASVSHARRKRSILEGIDDPVDNDLRDIALRDLLDVKREDIVKKQERNVGRSKLQRNSQRKPKTPLKPLNKLKGEITNSDEKKIEKIKILNYETYRGSCGITRNGTKGPSTPRDENNWQVESSESGNSEDGDDKKGKDSDKHRENDKKSDKENRNDGDKSSDSNVIDGVDGKDNGGYKDSDGDDGDKIIEMTSLIPPIWFYPTEKDPYDDQKFSDEKTIIQPVTYPPVDMEQYDADCPKVCPSRDVMVCGSCKDGVYRSFLSVCHMRMFNCKYPKEKVRLISRGPCNLLSPHHEDLETVAGRVAEPLNDDDLVLRFLWCKQTLIHHTAKLSKGHPGCKGVPLSHRLKPKG